MFSSTCSVINLIIIPLWCPFNFEELIRWSILKLNLFWHLGKILSLFDFFFQFLFYSFLMYLWICVKVTVYGMWGSWVVPYWISRLMFSWLVYQSYCFLLYLYEILLFHVVSLMLGFYFVLGTVFLKLSLLCVLRHYILGML